MPGHTSETSPAVPRQSNTFREHDQQLKSTIYNLTNYRSVHKIAYFCSELQSNIQTKVQFELPTTHTGLHIVSGRLPSDTDLLDWIFTLFSPHAHWMWYKLHMQWPLHGFKLLMRGSWLTRSQNWVKLLVVPTFQTSHVLCKRSTVAHGKWYLACKELSVFCYFEPVMGTEQTYEYQFLNS